MRSRFSEEAGKRVVDAIHAVLGTSAIYTLKPSYRVRKLADKRFRRKAGSSGSSFLSGVKAEDEPLILTGAMYDAVKASKTLSGPFAGLNTFEIAIAVDEDSGLNPRGYDYAEEMEHRAHFLEAGLSLVEDGFSDLLLDIVAEELML